MTGNKHVFNEKKIPTVREANHLALLEKGQGRRTRDDRERTPAPGTAIMHCTCTV